MKCRNFAHRGFSGEYPENTLLSFTKALEAGCEGMEFDVHLSRDGEIVIIHDETINRTGDKRGKVKDMTYEELCKVDFSYKFKGKYGFMKIPTLREYFELVKDKDIISNIELKTGVYEYPGIEAKVLELIKEFHMEEKVIVSSFNHYSVMRMKALAPYIKCGFLSDTWILDTGDYIEKRNIEAYHPDFHMITDELNKDLKSKGIEINTWTVNEEKDILRMIDLEVDGIIGNYPDRVKKILEERNLR